MKTLVVELRRVETLQIKDSYWYSFLLRRCGFEKALDVGKRVHELILRNGFEQETFVGNLLVEMYAKCGQFREAATAFDQIRYPNDFSYTFLITACVQNADVRAGICALRKMIFEGLKPQKLALLNLVTACSKERANKESREVHAHVTACGLEEPLCSILITMYANCDRLDQARILFNSKPSKSLLVWTAMIGAYVQHGCSNEAIHLFQQIDLEGLQPDRVSFIAVLGACSDVEALSEGKAIHARVISRGLALDAILGNSLVNLYNKCSKIPDAEEVFEQIEFKNLESWNSMVAAYAQNGFSMEAMEFFRQMLLNGMKPNDASFNSILGAWPNQQGSLSYGKEIHDWVTACGLDTHLVVGTALVNMYGKCGSLDDARKVFSSLTSKNVVSWNAMIGAYAEQGLGDEVIEFSHFMEHEGMRLNKVSFLNVIYAIENLAQGEATHARIVATGLPLDDFVTTALINMYGRCNGLKQARLIFDKMSGAGSVTWSTIISAYAQHGCGKKALGLYRRMQLEGVKPDETTYSNVVSACIRLGNRREGETAHARLIECGQRIDVILENKLLLMYSKVGGLDEAKQMFEKMIEKDVGSCTTMITTYIQQGLGMEALKLHQKMDLEGMTSDNVTLTSVLEACSSLGAIETGKMIHARIFAHGFSTDVVVMTALVNMYGKCGDVQSARNVFDLISEKSTVTWNVLLGAYFLNEYDQKVLALYQEMQIEPDDVTYTIVLRACSNLGALLEGKAVHASVARTSYYSDAMVSAGLIHMYGKCGCLEQATLVFKESKSFDTAVWNMMIAAYAHNGYQKTALDLYQSMDLEGVQPDGITFIGILSACSHAGLPDEAFHQFFSLRSDRGIMWRDEHFGCMVDVLGRIGRLDEAEEVLKHVTSVDGVAWLSLLGACQVHGDTQRGERISKIAMNFKPEKASSYVLMSNIYATVDRCAKIQKVGSWKWMK